MMPDQAIKIVMSIEWNSWNYSKNKFLERGF